MGVEVGLNPLKKVVGLGWVGLADTLVAWKEMNEWKPLPPSLF